MSWKMLVESHLDGLSFLLRCPCCYVRKWMRRVCVDWMVICHHSKQKRKLMDALLVE